MWPFRRLSRLLDEVREIVELPGDWTLRAVTEDLQIASHGARFNLWLVDRKQAREERSCVRQQRADTAGSSPPSPTYSRVSRSKISPAISASLRSPSVASNAERGRCESAVVCDQSHCTSCKLTRGLVVSQFENSPPRATAAHRLRVDYDA